MLKLLSRFDVYISDRVLCHFCFKPKVTSKVLAGDTAKKSQIIISSIILLKTALDALPLLSKANCAVNLTCVLPDHSAQPNCLYEFTASGAKRGKKFSSWKHLQVYMWKWKICTHQRKVILNSFLLNESSSWVASQWSTNSESNVWYIHGSTLETWKVCTLPLTN